MPTLRLPRPLAIWLLGAVALLIPRRASADGTTTAARRVWVETRPWTCASEAGAFARDLDLACDALGGICAVAEGEAQATHRAILVCESPARWSLRVETANRHLLYAVVLEGDREERRRKAAMWVARVGDDGPNEQEPAQTAPPPMSPPSPARKAPDADADGGATARLAPRPKKAWGGLTLDGQFGVTNSKYAQSFHGLHGGLLFDVGPLRLGLASSISQLFGGKSNTSGLSGGYNGPHIADVKTASVRAGWGAPFTDKIVGVWLEGGLAWGEMLHLDRSGGGIPPAGHVAPNATFLGPTVRAEVVLQVPLKAWVQPYVYAAGTHTSNEFDEGVQSALVGVGLACRGW